MALNRAPGLHREHFGFMSVRGFPEKEWDALLRQARKEGRRSLPGRIVATDIEREAVAAARLNARRAGVEEHISFSAGDFMRTEVPPGDGLVIFNPPYGERLGDQAVLGELYGRLGDFLKKSCQGYAGAVFTGNLALAKRIGLRTNRRIPFFNGDIECRLLLTTSTAAAARETAGLNFSPRGVRRSSSIRRGEAHGGHDQAAHRRVRLRRGGAHGGAGSHGADSLRGHHLFRGYRPGALRRQVRRDGDPVLHRDHGLPAEEGSQAPRHRLQHRRRRGRRCRAEPLTRAGPGRHRRRRPFRRPGDPLRHIGSSGPPPRSTASPMPGPSMPSIRRPASFPRPVRFLCPSWRRDGSTHGDADHGQRIPEARPGGASTPWSWGAPIIPC